jgi:hypothetical protein
MSVPGSMRTRRQDAERRRKVIESTRSAMSGEALHADVRRVINASRAS